MSVSSSSSQEISRTERRCSIGSEMTASQRTSPPRRASMRTSHHTEEHHATQSRYQRTFVEHCYHDHWNDPVDLKGCPHPTIPISLATETDAGMSKKGTARGLRGGVMVAFPEKLHTMLAAMEVEETSHVISWQPHGRCFLIHRKREFVETVMARFFHQSKLTSFQRQLNLYGFVRLTAGPDRGGYYHERFLRGRPDLCRNMARTRIKGNGMKAASSPGTEPDFYAMDYCGDSGADDHMGLIRSVSVDTEYDVAAVPPRVGSLPTKSILDSSFQMIEKLDVPDLVTSVSTSSMTLRSISPMLVSPPESPLQELKADAVVSWSTAARAFPTTSSSSDLWHLTPRDENRVLWEHHEDDDDDVPQTGDAVHFEGLKFRYLDHMDVDDFPDVYYKDQPTSCVWV